MKLTLFEKLSIPILLLSVAIMKLSAPANMGWEFVNHSSSALIILSLVSITLFYIVKTPRSLELVTLILFLYVPILLSSYFFDWDITAFYPITLVTLISLILPPTTTLIVVIMFTDNLITQVKKRQKSAIFSIIMVALLVIRLVEDLFWAAHLEPFSWHNIFEYLFLAGILTVLICRNYLNPGQQRVLILFGLNSAIFVVLDVMDLFI